MGAAEAQSWRAAALRAEAELAANSNFWKRKALALVQGRKDPEALDLARARALLAEGRFPVTTSVPDVGALEPCPR